MNRGANNPESSFFSTVKCGGREQVLIKKINAFEMPVIKSYLMIMTQSDAFRAIIRGI